MLIKCHKEPSRVKYSKLKQGIQEKWIKSIILTIGFSQFIIMLDKNLK